MRRSPLRRLLPCLLALVLGVTAAPAPAFAAVPTFTFYGKGYGHGIGLSQYGAQGHALNGSTYDQILAHYYQGTSLEAGTWVGDVEVNLDKYYGTSSFVGKASYTVTGINSALKVGTLDPIPAGTPYTVDAGGWVECADPGGVVRISQATGPYNATNKSYRGRLYFYRLSNGNLSVVDYVPFEQYLYGVVPCESPSTWNIEALKAQAVAARSYAHDDAARRVTLRCTTASQVYGGYNYEKPSTNNAVDQTAGQVVKYAGAVVRTFFSSASGGNTANIEDSWAYSDPKPYYTGVVDPYEGLAGSPHSAWTSAFSGSTIASKLRASSTVKSELANHGLPAIPADSTVYVSSISIAKGVSGYPRWVTFTFSNGVSCKLGSYTVKGALGMKSPNFSLDGSSSTPVDRIYGSDRFATSVAVSKRAFPSGAPAVVLASGQSFADALTGSGLAGAAGGAVLLTWKDTVPASVLAEIARLQPSKLYVMGGKGAVSDAALNAAKAKAPGVAVTRVDGSDRAETARKAADLVKAI
ncbi:MAG: hypothetical protein C0418_05940, partial [Coriobacteriaceae bacterium]|nr:hypothetical protein [Coriobacteriaceae bacterium]